MWRVVVVLVFLLFVVAAIYSFYSRHYIIGSILAGEVIFYSWMIVEMLVVPVSPGGV
jgi:hypothetical protein